MSDSSSDLSAAQQLTLNYIRRIARIVQTGAVLAAGVILLRATGKHAVEVAGAKVPLTGVWALLVFSALTGAHLYWAWFALDKMNEIREQTDAQARGDQLMRLVQTDAGWFLGGLIPRSDRIRPGSRIVLMDRRDPTTWISCGVAVLALVACLPWSVGKQGFAISGPVVGVIILVAADALMLSLNWWTGSNWIINLSQLGLTRDQQWALDEVEAWSSPFEAWDLARRRVRVIAIVAAVVMVPLALILLT